MRWTPKSWKKYKALQQPEYIDNKRHSQILSLIKKQPPLVFSGEVINLKKQIADAGDGKGFILQGGDCAERFIDCTEQAITNKLKILLQMSVILTHGTRKPVVRIGRIAGQYAKPRSHNTEVVNNVEILSFRGDCVNSIEPDFGARRFDPERLLTCFYHSSITLNYIRAMIDGGFADLHNPYSWNLYSIEKTKKWPEYKEVIERILDSINFMEAFGGINENTLGRVEFFTSHEGLLLGYEEALTRKDAKTGKYYNLGAHMLWIGERTRQVDGAHVEYCRGISNPLGIKIGSTCTTEELLHLLDILNPENEKGRITLIARMGIENVEKRLSRLVRAVKKTKRNVTWSCDPMHGNTTALKSGRKTRKFSDILNELKYQFNIHKSNGTYLAGLHFELTGENVTECLGGAVGLKGEDLTKNYETSCDPRLNYSQSLEMAFLSSRMLAHG